MENDWKLTHVGLVVKDLDETIEFYQSLGYDLRREVMERVSSNRTETYGKPPGSTIRHKSCFLGKGDFILEVIQPIEGESLQMEFSNRHGEGIKHIHFVVDDLDKEIAEMTEKGCPIIFSIKRPVAAD